jgi:hypothetical protein
MSNMSLSLVADMALPFVRNTEWQHRLIVVLCKAELPMTAFAC